MRVRRGGSLKASPLRRSQLRAHPSPPTQQLCRSSAPLWRTCMPQQPQQSGPGQQCALPTLRMEWGRRLSMPPTARHTTKRTDGMAQALKAQPLPHQKAAGRGKDCLGRWAPQGLVGLSPQEIQRGGGSAYSDYLQYVFPLTHHEAHPAC